MIIIYTKSVVKLTLSLEGDNNLEKEGIKGFGSRISSNDIKRTSQKKRNDVDLIKTGKTLDGIGGRSLVKGTGRTVLGACKICGPDGVFRFQLESPLESYLEITQNQIDDFLEAVDPGEYSPEEKDVIQRNKKNPDSTTGNYKISPLQYYRMELAKLAVK